MAAEVDYKFEKFEEYYGTIDEIKKKLDECSICGAKLILNHLPDYKNLLIQETARCLDCGHGNRKTIHILN